MPADVIAVHVEFADGRIVPVELAGERKDSAAGNKGRGASTPSVKSSWRPDVLVQSLEALAAALEKPEEPVWLTHKEAANRLRVHTGTLKSTMVSAASAGTPAPASNNGTETRPRYGWLAAEIDAWWLEVRGVGKGSAEGKATRRRSMAAKGSGKPHRGGSLRDRLRDRLDSAASDREA